MSLEELKAEEEKSKKVIKSVYGWGSSKAIKEYRKSWKDYLKCVQDWIWRREIGEESFQNHINAIRGFVENTHML